MSDKPLGTVAWRTGKIPGTGLDAWSKLHVLAPESYGRLTLCGARGNWMIGEFGHTHEGPCRACKRIAENRGLAVVWDDEGGSDAGD